MGALATCTVRRQSLRDLNQEDKLNGFKADEQEYSGTILFFENAKAYVVRDDNSSLYWIAIALIQNVEPIL